MKSKKEIARELARVATVSYFHEGSFVCVSVTTSYNGTEHDAYAFSKCALSLDDFSLDLGIRIGVNRCLNKIAKRILAGGRCREFFSGAWCGESDYGPVGVDV